MKHLYLLVILSLFFVACGEESAEKTVDGTPHKKAGKDAWVVAVMPTLDCMPLFLAYENGFFDKAGVAVSLRGYKSQMDVDTALLNKRVAGGVTDLVRAERLGGQGVALDYVTATSADWQLISKRTARISKLAQLDDKMMAMTRYSATDLLADVAVDSAKLKTERVFRIQINDVSVRFGMLQADIMDAMFLPEPQATAARNLKGRVLLDTRQLDLRLGTLVFRKDVLKGNEKRLKAFLKAYDQAVDSLNANGLSYYGSLLGQYTNVAQQTIDSLAPDFKYRHAEKPRENDLQRVKAWWSKRSESMKYVEKRYLQ